MSKCDVCPLKDNVLAAALLRYHSFLVKKPMITKLLPGARRQTIHSPLRHTCSKGFPLKHALLPAAIMAVSQAAWAAPELSFPKGISGLTFDGSGSQLTAQESSPATVTFNNDGTQMYIIGDGAKAIHMYPLTRAFDISSAGFVRSSVSLNIPARSPVSGTFNTDGSKLYVLSHFKKKVYQYSLTTPFDINTLDYDNLEFDISAQEIQPWDMAFNGDGTKFYLVGYDSDQVHQYSMSTAYDLSTASYDSVSMPTTPLGFTLGLNFNGDGSRLYLVGEGKVSEFALSTAYDISTASHVIDANLQAQDGTMRSVVLSPDSTKLFTIGANSDRVYQYSLPGSSFSETGGSAGNGEVSGQVVIKLSEDTFVNRGATLTSPTHFIINNLPAGLIASIQVAADGTSGILSLSGSANDSQASNSVADLQISFTDAAFAGGDASAVANSTNTNIGVGINFSDDTQAPSLSVWTAVATPGFDSTPRFGFSADEAGNLSMGGSCGTITATFMTAGNNTLDLSAADNRTPLRPGTYNDCTVTLTDANGNASAALAIPSFTIQQPSLSYSTPAVNISEGREEPNKLRTSAVENQPIDSAFNADGTRLFVLGWSSDGVSQYSLSTPYNVSTASYDNKQFDLSNEDSNPYAFTFNGDGTKLYSLGISTDTVYQYSLSTAYDLTTVNYDSISLNIGSQDGAPGSLSFNRDGTKLYVLGQANDRVFQYDLSTPYDLSTATYNNLSRWYGAQQSSGHGFVFSKDGSKLYISGRSPAGVHQYSVSTPFDVSTANYDNVFYDTAAGERFPYDIEFNDTANKFYLTGINFNAVSEYSLPPAGLSETNGGSGNGAVSGQVDITIEGDTFVNAGGTLASPTHFNIGNLPQGLSASLRVAANGRSASLVITGSSSASQASDSISDLQFSFTDAAFTGGDASVIANTSNASTGLSISFSDDSVKPIADPQIISTSEDTAKAITLTATDANSDNSQLNYTVLTNPANGQLTGTAPNLSFVPAANFSGRTSFTFKANDGALDSDSETVTILVAPVNDAPSISSTAPLVATEDEQYVYSAMVADVDDVNNGSDLSWQLVNEPSGMSVSNTGRVTWTPTEGVSSSGLVTLRVSDGGEDAAAPDEQSFSIAVTPVNDAPSITSSAGLSAIEDTQYRYQATVNDSDDLNNGTDLSWSLINAPAGMEVSNTGLVTWTPTEGMSTSGAVTLRVRDGGEDAASAGEQSFTVAVTAVNDAPTISSTAPTSATEDVLYSYQASVVDVDDVNNGTDLSWELSNAPAGMAVSSTGLVTWTPTEGMSTSGAVTLRVRDGGENGAAAAEQNFTIAVSAVNDTPMISGSPATTAIENRAYSFTPLANDVDANDSLSFSISNMPSWAGFNSATGALTGTPTSAHVGSYSSIVITVTDAANLSASLPAFSILVDSDQDGDGEGDRVDSDIDGDGISNDFELANGLDPRDASDASLDSDNDGTSNLDEFAAGTDPQRDDYAPVISFSDAEVSIDASGLLTSLPNALASASDGLDGEVRVTHNLTSDLLEPGRHVITWTARDAAGNEITRDQIVNVRPIANWQLDQQSGEGNTVQVRLILNGEAPEYPVIANYSVTGSATNPDDHDAMSGRLEITQGTEAELEIRIAQDMLSENDEDIVITLDSLNNAAMGEKLEHRIVISEFNHAPMLALSATEAGSNEAQTLFDTSAGTVTIAAKVSDVDVGDRHSFDWQADSALAGLESMNEFSFEPSLVGAGTYQVSVTATDNANDAKSGSDIITITVVDRLPSLSSADRDQDGIADNLEGYGDSDGDNVPDFADSTQANNLLAIYPLGGEPVAGAWFVETEVGLQLELNLYSGASGKYSPLVADEDLVDSMQVDHADAGYAFDVGMFDFVVSNMPVQGESVNVVIPQLNVIPENAVYRKEINGRWGNYVEDANNSLHSAAGERGVCPPPGSDAYQPGLEAGHYCVQVTIEDGGPNDADGKADGNIVDPGGVGVGLSSSISSSGGAGSAGWGVVALLTALSSLVVVRRRARTSNAPKCSARANTKQSV